MPCLISADASRSHPLEGNLSQIHWHKAFTCCCEGLDLSPRVNSGSGCGQRIGFGSAQLELQIETNMSGLSILRIFIRNLSICF